MEFMRRDIGAHKIEVEADLVAVTSAGRWSLEQTEQMIAIWDEVKAAHGRLFYLGDFSSGINLDAAVRRRLIAWAKSNRFTALALVVTSLPVRALAMLVVRGAQIMNPDSPTPSFCATVHEARQAIEQARQAHQKQ